jgi:hypothetical protein
MRVHLVVTVAQEGTSPFVSKDDVRQLERERERE